MAKFKDEYVEQVVEKIREQFQSVFEFVPTEELVLKIAKEVEYVSSKPGRTGGTLTTDKGKEYLGVSLQGTVETGKETALNIE